MTGEKKQKLNKKKRGVYKAFHCVAHDAHKCGEPKNEREITSGGSSQPGMQCYNTSINIELRSPQI